MLLSEGIKNLSSSGANHLLEMARTMKPKLFWTMQAKGVNGQ
jgi:hypothetical protein